MPENTIFDPETSVLTRGHGKQIMQPAHLNIHGNHDLNTNHHCEENLPSDEAVFTSPISQCILDEETPHRGHVRDMIELFSVDRKYMGQKENVHPLGMSTVKGHSSSSQQRFETKKLLFKIGMHEYKESLNNNG